MFHFLLSWILVIPFLQPPKITPARTHTNAITTIIFDIDGLLCTTDKKKFLGNVGMKQVMRYILGTGTFPSNKSVLQALQEYPATINATDNPDVYSLNQGNSIPHIMLDWQCGAHINPEKIAEWIQHNLNISKYKKDFLINTTKAMFTPELFIATRKVIPGGIALARNLHEQGYRLVILSNWDGQSFELLQKTFPELFTTSSGNPLFDHIYTSAQISQACGKPMLKPMPEIYNYVIADLHSKTTEYELVAHNCLLIDDEHENCKNALSRGLHAVRAHPTHMKKTHNNVVKLLKKYNQ